MIAASAGAFGWALFLPVVSGREFWQLDPDHGPTMVIALLVAAIAVVLVEAAHAVVNRGLTRAA